ncbi:MAG TPA: MFS transporter [Solirubrobacterales bacterium]|jgi:predicted MFS family arabinose efflux permease|nr:MFS transporter [Solirubrobacterales bacterium]
MPSLAGRVGVLREPNYRRLFFGRTISLVGDGIAPVAIAFAVLDLTGSATDLGIVLAAHSLLITALVLVGGVFGDRISPRLAMLRADLVRMAAMGLIAALLIAGVAEIWQLAILYAIVGAATAFFNPASNAIVPAIVAAPRLQEANALLNLSRSLGKLVGPALAGILLALGSPGAALAADAASFGISAFFLLRLRAPRVPPSGEPAFFAELRGGWSEFASRSWLWAVVLSAAFTNAIFFPAFQVLGPTVANESLGGSSDWALIAASLGLGSLIGGGLALTIRPRRPLLLGEGLLICIGVPIALLALPAVPVAIAFGALVTGLALSLAEVLYETAAAQQIPREALSRVTAYDWFGSLALQPLGLLLVGPLAAGVGIPTTLWLAAAAVTLCQAAVLCVPSVRRLPAGPPAEPTTVLRATRPIEPGD